MAASSSVERLDLHRLHRIGSALHLGDFVTLSLIECCHAYVFTKPLAFSSIQHFRTVSIASSPSLASPPGGETVRQPEMAGRLQNN